MAIEIVDIPIGSMVIFHRFCKFTRGYPEYQIYIVVPQFDS